MKTIYLISLFVLSTFFSCKAQNEKEVYKSENLVIQQLTENTFVHISYLQTQDFGNVACNGMLFINGDEAMVFDTPTNDIASEELIDWLNKDEKMDIKGVIATHFHDDCLGGLKKFHDSNIPSYASEQTIKFANKQNSVLPKTSLNFDVDLEINGKEVRNLYFGEGHTKDNIVCYIPSEKVLFGGCLIKEVGATKGYLGDANTDEWSNTVTKIKKGLPDIKFVIPGHGKTGGTELLTYTIKLFNEH
ncbi:subclass B1 metallo-beta-lactamase [Aureibaculum sp. 2210JD6-5]|uniref:subclass B1 metallo-beta-lactamase n=1 Tax=Aureibaculum sp. 2210JD6-5 TaxID=3103957 RepID=UPI002AAC80B1|nr:subclass B1 metallo-beta-lactamase [Aureibaculum sp. 2210JD6-5]MDY7395444.1 subclass B1 metallo-beta-lactamase [Aureibaculum sp. 2210JD6-5]